MKRSIIIAVVICIVALMAVLLITRNNDTVIEKSVTFKLVKTYGAETKPKEALLSRVYGLEMDNNQNIYIIDRSERLVSFASDGSFRWQINRIGKGPGDIEYPSGMASDGEKFLYLANINGTRIDKFDLDGNFISSVNAGNVKLDYLHIIGFIKPNLLIISKSLMGKIAQELFLVETDKNYSIKNHFIIDKTDGLKLPKNGSLGFGINVSDGRIAAGSITEYELSIYNTEGKVEKKFSKSIKNVFMAYAGENGAGIAGSISPPYKINGSYYLVSMVAPSNVTEMSQLFKRDFKKEYSNTIDIFNNAGDLVYSKKNEGRINTEIGQPLRSDSEGYLYTFKESPYPQICKYQVIISD